MPLLELAADIVQITRKMRFVALEGHQIPGNDPTLIVYRRLSREGALPMGAPDRQKEQARCKPRVDSGSGGFPEAYCTHGLWESAAGFAVLIALVVSVLIKVFLFAA
jgi:hypothetical protein